MRRRLLLGACRWCSGPIRAARIDARYCSKRCRQAAHRAAIGRVAIVAADRPLRLAYADPPYPGLARYYAGQPDYAGEVDHRALLEQLRGFDGWALSTSARALPRVIGMGLELDLELRVAVWVRRARPHPTARVVSGYEPVLYSPARSVALGSGETQTVDALVGAESRPRPTLPGAVLGMKPPAFAVWIFGLLGARLGDSLADLYPGSGIVARSWELYQGRDPSRVAGARQLELL